MTAYIIRRVLQMIPLLFGVTFFPILALPIWVLVAGIVLLRNSTAPSN